jgi:hypothetical protein
MAATLSTPVCQVIAETRASEHDKVFGYHFGYIVSIEQGPWFARCVNEVSAHCRVG